MQGISSGFDELLDESFYRLFVLAQSKNGASSRRRRETLQSQGAKRGARKREGLLLVFRAGQVQPFMDGVESQFQTV